MRGRREEDGLKENGLEENSLQEEGGQEKGVSRSQFLHNTCFFPFCNKRRGKKKKKLISC